MDMGDSDSEKGKWPQAQIRPATWKLAVPQTGGSSAFKRKPRKNRLLVTGTLLEKERRNKQIKNIPNHSLAGNLESRNNGGGGSSYLSLGPGRPVSQAPSCPRGASVPLNEEFLLSLSRTHTAACIRGSNMGLFSNALTIPGGGPPAPAPLVRKVVPRVVPLGDNSLRSSQCTRGGRAQREG